MADVPVVGGAGGINVPTDSTGVPVIQSLGEMARRALRMLNIIEDHEAERTALEGLQRAVTKVNLVHHFDFTTEVETDTTLVENQIEYDLPDDTFAIKEIILVDDSTTPESTLPLSYIDWDQLVRGYDLGGRGTPSNWTVRDVQSNRKISLLPAPDAGAVTKYDLRIYFHKRITRPPINDLNVQIAGPIELSEVLITYAQAHLLFTYERDNPQGFYYKEKEAEKMLAQFKGSRNRTTPGVKQIRMEGIHAPARHGRRNVIRWGG